jgi:transposase
MRKLPAAAQEERRRQVVGLRQRGLTYRAIAGQVGLSRTGGIDICQRFAAEGRSAWSASRVGASRTSSACWTRRGRPRSRG